jgi:asparagine synthase (glutamine-hydrolysing)
MLGYVPVSRTIYKDIFRMPRRAILTVDLESGKKEQLQYALPAPSANDAKTMQALLEQAVERHLVADVPVGLFFSGGTDSSLIASILAKQGASLEAFSVEIDKRPEDREYFEKIASTLRLKPHHYFFGVNEFDDVYPAVTARIDEPLYDSALFPTYFISREARKRVKVALSGDGGDEYFLGYPQIMRLSRIHDARLDGKMGLLDYLYVMTPRFRGKADLFARLFILAHRPISYYLAAVSPAKDFVTAREWRAAKRTLAEHGTTPTALDADFYLENDILRKTDLATMYNSLEGRLPLLDADVIASAEKMMRRRVPLREKKPLLKEILASYLSRDLVYRGKRGFGLDSHVFFAKSRYLKNDLVAAIDYLNKRDLLPPKALMPHEALIRRRSQMCWQVLSLYHALKNAGV